MNEATKRHLERERADELEAARLDATTAQDQRDEAIRDVTALRSELGAIAIFMQDRGQLGDLGGANFALVEGAVMTYVLALELATVALNEDRQGLLEQIGGLQNLLACDDDCTHAPMCPRWEHGADDPFEYDVIRDEAGAPLRAGPWGFAGEDPVEP